MQEYLLIGLAFHLAWANSSQMADLGLYRLPDNPMIATDGTHLLIKGY